MVYLSRIYTRTGDQGETALGDGSRRWSKDHPRVAAYGSVDELNSVLGLLAAHAPTTRWTASAPLCSPPFKMISSMSGADMSRLPSEAAKPDRRLASSPGRRRRWRP